MNSRQFIAIILLLPGWLTGSIHLRAQDTDLTPIPGMDATQTDAVNAYFIVPASDPLIGEPFDLDLIVETPPGAEIIQWVTFPEDAEPFELLEADDVTTQTGDGTIRHQQTLTLILWQTGQHITPQLTVRVSVPGVSSAVFPVASAVLNIPTVLADVTEPQPRPSIAPVDVFYLPDWIIGVVIVILATVLYGLLRLLPARRHSPGSISRGSPAQMTIARLEDLAAQQLAAEIVYPAVADYLRQYLGERFQIQVNEMTTGELNQYLRTQRLLPDRLRKSLRQILEQADLVKFARFAPDARATNRLINAAIRWIRETTRLEVSHD